MVCNRCKVDKEESGFFRDFRREGKSCFYQQPCKECRNAQRRVKRRVDYAERYLSAGVVSYRVVRRGTNLKPGDVDKGLLDLCAQNLFLKRDLAGLGRPFYEKGFLFCQFCESVVSLPEKCSVKEMIDILAEFNNMHDGCSHKNT